MLMWEGRLARGLGRAWSRGGEESGAKLGRQKELQEDKIGCLHMNGGGRAFRGFILDFSGNGTAIGNV